MNLTVYIDNRFQEAKMKEAGNVRYSAWLDAEMKALDWSLGAYRFFFKCVHIPLIFIGFLAMHLGLRREPKAVIVEQIKKQKEAEKVAAALAAEVIANMPDKPGDELQTSQ